MNWIGRVGLIGAGVGLALTANGARAQGSCTFVDESGKTVTWPNCQPPADPNAPPAAKTAPSPAPGGSPAKSFPYPGSEPAAPANAPTAPAAGQDAGSASPGSGNAPSGNKFPYPGDPGNGAAQNGNPATAGGKPGPPTGDGLNDAGSSGSSSSSSSSSSGADQGDGGPLGGDDDPAAKAADIRRSERKRLSNAPAMTPDEREVEDLKVAAFYQNDGNFKGAYDRAVDAVSLAAEDADAHFALAEAARRLGKLDEAEKHYKTCLTLDPVPKTKRAAEKALKEMSGGV